MKLKAKTKTKLVSKQILVTKIKELKEKDKELKLLLGVSALLHWDRATQMPVSAVEERGDQLAYLGVLAHSKATDSKLYSLVNFLFKYKNQLSKIDCSLVERFKIDLSKQRKIPQKHVEDFARLSAESEHYWEVAREKKNYGLFKPYLEKVVAMKKKEAKLIDSKRNAYDVLLQDYEEGTTIAQIDPVFDQFKKELIEIINKIKSSKKYKQQKNKFAKLKFSVDKQKEAVADVISYIVDCPDRFFDYKSVHPFTTRMSYNDVRQTTAYRKSDPLFSFTSTAHESGHALYELGMGANLSGGSLCDAPSFGIHESQSRIWENQVMRGKPFWKFYWKKFAAKFPELKKLGFEEFLFQVNKVEPSFIRIEADEVTYAIHIIIRYEIEKDLFAGKIKVKYLPKEWNKRYKQYLGITPRNDSEGVLQDVHWSSGFLGYFPTYLIGTMYSAMLFNQIKKEIPDIEKQFSKGKFDGFRNWLREKIHKHGRTMSTPEIIKKATGRELTHVDLINYFKEKYYPIYGIKE